jgi:VanZ family protein
VSRKTVSRLLWTVTLCFWMFIFVMTHIPQQRLPDVPVSDKGTHVITFAVLGSLLYGTVWLSRPEDWSGVWKVPLILTLYGAFDEATQPLANRSGEFADWYADVAGAVLAVALWTGVRWLIWRLRGGPSHWQA